MTPITNARAQLARNLKSFSARLFQEAGVSPDFNPYSASAEDVGKWVDVILPGMKYDAENDEIVSAAAPSVTNLMTISPSVPRGNYQASFDIVDGVVVNR